MVVVRSLVRSLGRRLGRSLGGPGVRGGGEKGAAWHEAGRGPRKGTAVRDYIACAEWLVKQGYTSPAKLAIQGGSQGGIYVGRSITERPDLFGLYARERLRGSRTRDSKERKSQSAARHGGSIADRDEHVDPRPRPA